MKLIDYLAENGLNPTAFARRINVRPITIQRYLTGERLPRKEEMARIHEATGGAVEPNDFYPIEVEHRPCHGGGM